MSFKLLHIGKVQVHRHATQALHDGPSSAPPCTHVSIRLTSLMLPAHSQSEGWQLLLLGWRPSKSVRGVAVVHAGAADLALTLWALAKLDHRPPAETMQSLALRAQGVMHR